MSHDALSTANQLHTQVEAAYIDSIALDFVILALHEGQLNVLCLHQPQDGRPLLPGGYLHDDTRLGESAHRHLQSIVSDKGVYYEQLQAFDDQATEQERYVLRIAYAVLLNPKQYQGALGGSRFELTGHSVKIALSMADGHDAVLRFSLEFLRRKIKQEPIVFHLLPEKFTLSNLQEAYEAILDVRYRKSNFRRKLARMDFLVPCRERQRDVAHRAAELYRFDERIYRQVCENGYEFSL